MFVHEFAGDHRSWEPQVRFFGRRHRCIAYAARGYPPSDVPEKRRQLFAEARRRRHSARSWTAPASSGRTSSGCRWARFATLHFGLDYPERALSLVAAGVGYGAEKTREAAFRQGAEQVARGFETKGSRAFAEIYGVGAARVQLEAKDPRGWREFVDQLAEHAPLGAANTMRGVQAKRPSLYDLEDELQRLAVPTLIVAGDEDDNSLQPSIFLKLDHPGVRPFGPAEDRAHAQSRGARRVQPRARRVLRPGHRRALAAARPARPTRRDPQDLVGADDRLYSSSRPSPSPSVG